MLKVKCELVGRQTVVARRADREKTNKISSPQPSPKERECSNGKVGRRNDEQMTVRATQAVVARQADSEKTEVTSPYPLKEGEL